MGFWAKENLCLCLGDKTRTFSAVWSKLVQSPEFQTSALVLKIRKADWKGGDWEVFVTKSHFGDRDPAGGFHLSRFHTFPLKMDKVQHKYQTILLEPIDWMF